MRLTLTSNIPVTAADVISGGTLYLTPYLSGDIWVPDSGGTWVRRNTSQLSLSLSGATQAVYDVFVWDNGGTLTLKLSTAWTNSTTRANALTTLNGITVNGSTEGSMAASRGLWLGMIRPYSANTCDDQVAMRGLLNAFNKVPRKLFACPNYFDNNASTTYTLGNVSVYTAFPATANGFLFLSDGATPYECDWQCLAGGTNIVGVAENATSGVRAVSQAAASTMNSGSYSGILAAGLHSLIFVYKNAAVTATADAARTGATADPPATFLKATMHG